MVVVVLFYSANWSGTETIDIDAILASKGIAVLSWVRPRFRSTWTTHWLLSPKLVRSR